MYQKYRQKTTDFCALVSPVPDTQKSALLSARIHLCDTPEDLLVGGAEIILRDLCGGDPADVVVLKLLRDSLGYGGAEESQMHRNIGVAVHHLHKNLPHVHGDVQLLAALAHQRLLFCLTGLYFAAYKLPEQSTRLVLGSLTYHKSVFVPYEGRYYFCHILHRRSLSQQDECHRYILPYPQQ